MHDRSGPRHESHGRRWTEDGVTLRQGDTVLDGHRITAYLNTVPLHTPKPYLTLVELPKATTRRSWWRFWRRGR